MAFFHKIWQMRMIMFVKNMNLFTLSGFFYYESLDWSISNSRVSG